MLEEAMLEEAMLEGGNAGRRQCWREAMLEGGNAEEAMLGEGKEGGGERKEEDGIGSLKREPAASEGGRKKWVLGLPR